MEESSPTGTSPAAWTPAPGSGDRRRVIILFADLVGFSTLAEELDPEELRSLATETFADLSTEVERRDGRVEKFIGDAVMAVFGAPLAHEDDPDRAVETALGMMEVVGGRSRSPGMPQLRLRIGINSGLVVSGGVGDGTQTGVMGDAVNVAARLQQAADPGEILVSASVWRRVQTRYEGEPMGPIEVKGREQRVETYRLLGPRTLSERRQSPFVGRREELALLELLWSSSMKGNTHVVSILGEPGVGKSRLLAEFPHRGDALDLRVRCQSDRAFGPFLDLLQQILSGPPSGIEDLKSRAARLGVEEGAAVAVAVLFGLSGAPPTVALADEQQKRQVYAGVWQFLVGILRRQSMLIVFDDVHWSDQSSLDLLGFLLERLVGLPLTLLLAYRPGFERVERAALRASHTGIRLELLGPLESVALARGFLGANTLPPDLDRIISTRAEGNPFFIEELLQALLELGSLAIVNGEAVLAKVEMEIPDTVQGTILARIDRLGEKERSILQHASVIGRTFSTGLIQAVMGEDGVAEGLETLSRAQLVILEGPERWTFKHSLIQEMTYETLLHRQRRDLHRKTAVALEAWLQEGDASLEMVAEHYAQAEVHEEARRYAIAAGDVARERMGFAEAKDLYERALRLWGEGDEQGRMDVLMKLSWAALLTSDIATARTSLIEAEAGWRALGNNRQAGAALAMLGRGYFFSGETDRATESLQQALTLLEPAGPTPELVQALVWFSILNIVSGRAEEGAALSRKGLDMVEGLDLDGARSHLLTSLGSFEVMMGDPSGVERVRQGLDLAEAAGDVEAIGRAYLNVPIALSELSENSEGVALCRQGREVMRKLGSATFEWTIAGKEAELLAELGRYDESAELCREILGTHRAMVVAPSLVWAGSTLALIHARKGRFEEARAQINEVLPVAHRVGGSMFLPAALLTEAELEEGSGNMAAAALAMKEVLEVLLATSSVAHQFRAIVPAAKLLPREEAAQLVDRVSDKATHRSFEARLYEAEGYLDEDRARLAMAADLYETLALPYQEARCRLELGQLDRAGEIIGRLGLAEGPLGARLRASLGAT